MKEKTCRGILLINTPVELEVNETKFRYGKVNSTKALHNIFLISVFGIKKVRMTTKKFELIWKN